MPLSEELPAFAEPAELAVGGAPVERVTIATAFPRGATMSYTRPPESSISPRSSFGVVLAAAFLGMTLPLVAIRYSVAVILVGLGIVCLIRHQHPRWVRMRVDFKDLTVWSFLMASAHGAGLMVVPVLLGSSTVEAQRQLAGHNHHMPSTASPLAGMLATGVHTVAYLAVTGLIAWVVYRKLGLALLRKAWLNFDLVWAAALVATGIVTLLM